MKRILVMAIFLGMAIINVSFAGQLDVKEAEKTVRFYLQEQAKAHEAYEVYYKESGIHFTEALQKKYNQEDLIRKKKMSQYFSDKYFTDNKIDKAIYLPDWYSMDDFLIQKSEIIDNEIVITTRIYWHKQKSTSEEVYKVVKENSKYLILPSVHECSDLAKSCYVYGFQSRTLDNGYLYDGEKTEVPQLIKPKAYADNPKPFGWEFGVSNPKEVLESARDLGAEYSEENTGFGSAKPISIDRQEGSVPNERVFIAGVTKLPIPQSGATRIGFFDKKLFFVNYEISGDIENVKKMLIEKYGSFNNNEGDKYEWIFKTVSIVLTHDFMGHHTLQLYYEPFRVQAEQSNHEVYEAYIKAKAKEQKGF
jgi:hypothetical protein